MMEQTIADGSDMNIAGLRIVYADVAIRIMAVTFFRQLTVERKNVLQETGGELNYFFLPPLIVRKFPPRV